jgi:hypothetical protein
MNFDKMISSIRRGAKSKLARICLGASMCGFLVAGSPDYLRAEEPSATGDIAEFIEEATPAGIPIKILRSIFGGEKKETHVHIHQEKEENYQQPRHQRESYRQPTKNIKLPQFFNATKEVRSGVYTDIKDIFYPGEKIYVVAENMLGKVTNFWIAFDKNEQIPQDLVNGSNKVEIVFKGYLNKNEIAWGKFDASSVLEKYGNNHRVYWLQDDRIVGHRDFVIMDKRPNEYSMK